MHNIAGEGGISSLPSMQTGMNFFLTVHTADEIKEIAMHQLTKIGIVLHKDESVVIHNWLKHVPLVLSVFR